MEENYNKHAYLILAHKNPEQLKKLVKLLDSVQNDIYIHIDSKSDIKDDFLEEINFISRITVIKKVRVEWGAYSIVEAELELLQEATKTYHLYYHLISGLDLPLKPIGVINQWFEKNIEYFGKKYEYVHFCGEEACKSALEIRTARLRFKSRIIKKWLGKIYHDHYMKSRAFQKVSYGYGGQWFDISHELACELFEHKEWIHDTFQYFEAADEHFVQSYILTFGKSECCYMIDHLEIGYKMVMRLIDFSRGNGKSPYVFQLKDFDELTMCGMNFARKFDETVDSDIVDTVYHSVEKMSLKSDNDRLLK